MAGSQGYHGLKLPVVIGEFSYSNQHKAGDVPDSVTMPQFARCVICVAAARHLWLPI